MEAVRTKRPKVKKAKEKAVPQEEDEEVAVYVSSRDENVVAAEDLEPDEYAFLLPHADGLTGSMVPNEPSEANTEKENHRSHDIISTAQPEMVEPYLTVPAVKNEPGPTSAVIPAPKVRPINPFASTVSRPLDKVLSKTSSLSQPTAIIQLEQSVKSLERAYIVNGEAVRNRESTGHLYPSLAEKAPQVSELLPLSRAQMKVYFINAEARALEAVIDQFIECNQTSSLVHHPLYIYLAEYHQALVASETAREDLNTLRNAYDQLRDSVWKITDNRAVEPATCADNRNVYGEQYYRQCHLDQTALSDLASNLERIRELLYQTCFQHQCTAELARLQIEVYLHDVIRTKPLTANLNDSLSTVPRPELVALTETSELRTCIGILFAFHRIPLSSAKFREDVRLWLTETVGTLLRVSTFYDQIFLLCHLLRCPSSVIQWAAAFLQISLPQTFSGKLYNDPYIKHFVVLFQCLLIPTKARNAYLSAFTINHFGSDDADSSWIMVDPDADGAEMMKIATTVDIEENDVFQLMMQFPCNRMFSSLFGSDCLDLGPFGAILEYDVLALFGFCHEFLDILTEGREMEIEISSGVGQWISLADAFESLKRPFRYGYLNLMVDRGNFFLLSTLRVFFRLGLANPALTKYARFNKKISQTIRETVMHLKEYWERLSEMNEHKQDNLTKLKIQFEELVIRGATLLLQHGKHGTLQFLIGWPSRSLSPSNIWRLVVVLESGKDTSALSYNSDLNHWKKRLLDINTSAALSEKVQFLDEANATYLLTALSGVVQYCDSSMMDLVEIVLTEIFTLTFLGPLRSAYAKCGRDLLGAICQKHPVLISDLLRLTRKNMEQLGMMAVYLFQEIPLKLWHVERLDLDCLCEWLVNASNIQDPSCSLAREVLTNLNWGFTETGELHLRYDFHSYVAIAVVEAFLKFTTTKQRRALLYESLLRLSHMVTAGKATPEQNLVSWCWEVLLDLKLHRLTQSQAPPPSILRNNSVLDDDVPNLSRDLAQLGPLQAVEQRQPMACYVAIMMTDVGHTTTGVLDQGMGWIMVLIENYLYVPALQILETVTPLFFTNNQFIYLLQQDQFHYMISAILQADATYVRMVKNLLTSDFPGKTLMSFGNMLLYQLLRAGPSLPLAIRMWARIFTSLKNWNRTRETLFILDQIAKYAFYAREFETLMTVLREAYEEHRQMRPIRGGTMTSLVSWMTSGTTPTYNLVDGADLSRTPWLAYAVIQVEAESFRRFWQNLLVVLTGEKKRTFEDGIKKAIRDLDIGLPAVTDLPIHLAAFVIISADVKTDILPLLCQEFFKLFLERSPNHASIGDQFFLSVQGTKLLKPMKAKLREAAEYYRGKVNATSGIPLKQYQDLQRAMNAFTFWLDEPKLHQSTLYLPSLPPEYEPQMLGTILHSNYGPWRHLVDIERLEASMRTLAEHWVPFDVRPARQPVPTLFSPSHAHENPAPPPRTYSRSRPFIRVEPESVLDPSKVLPALRADLTIIQEAAKTYSNTLSRHLGLDLNFLEHMTDLNSNVEKEKTVFASCHKSQCSGPAEVHLKYKEYTRNETVYRLYVQNREDWLKLVVDAQNICLKNLVVSVVKAENAVSFLVEMAKNERIGEGRVFEVGAMLFYHMLVFMGEETDEHPLTRKFFHSCVDVLGQYFVAHQPKQCGSLLDICLNNQRAVPVLLPHFTPNVVPREFLRMYRKIQQSLLDGKSDMLMQLLSAFNVAAWLTDSHVDVSSRLELLSSISNGIARLGFDVSFQECPLFETYSRHDRNILEYRFPLHLMDVLNLLLTLSEKSLLPHSGWSSCLFSVLRIKFSKDFGSELINNIPTAYLVAEDFSLSGMVGLDTALHVASELTHWFTRVRLRSGQLYGLYPSWKNYMDSLAVLNLAFGSVIVKENSEIVVSFTKITDLFSPWINLMSVDGSDLPPWIQPDTAFASQMIASLLALFSLLVKKCSEVVVQIWSWYYTSFLVTRADPYMVAAVSSGLSQIDWQKFVPDFVVIEQFLLVTENGPNEARIFLADITNRIPWGTVHTMVKYSDRQQLMSMSSNIIRIFLFFATDSAFQPFAKPLQNFIEGTKAFSWECMSTALFADSISAVLKDPESLSKLAEGSIEEAPVIKFLSLISGFHSDNLKCDETTVEKRSLYLHIYGRAAVAWYSANDRENLVTFVKKLLSRIEEVWASAEPGNRHRGYVALCCEVFGLSNYISDKKVDVLLRGAILVWISQSSGSQLLVPMIAACCRSVVNLELMVKFLEALIVSYFRGSGTEDWNPVIFALEPPELSMDQFVQECRSQQNFLTLFAHYCRSSQVCANDPEKTMNIFRDLVDTCKHRPLPEHEAKVFVLWNHLLVIASGMGSTQEVLNGMRSFTETVFSFAEEKTGILSAIGVGRQTALSRGFKLVARSLAVVISPMTPSAKISRKSGSLATDTRNAYEGMKGRKEYAQYGEGFAHVDNCVASQGSLSWDDVRRLFAVLVADLYKHQNFLVVISAS